MIYYVNRWWFCKIDRIVFKSQSDVWVSFGFLFCGRIYLKLNSIDVEDIIEEMLLRIHKAAEATVGQHRTFSIFHALCEVVDCYQVFLSMIRYSESYLRNTVWKYVVHSFQMDFLRYIVSSGF